MRYFVIQGDQQKTSKHFLEDGMSPILFKIGGLSVYTHGFFLVIATLASAFVMLALTKNKHENKEIVFDLVVFSLLFGIIGARITYFLLYRNQFSDFTELFKLWEGGLVSWGGFLTGVLTFIIIIKRYRENVWYWLDILGISFFLGMSIGRFGSFLSGELAGKASSGLFSIKGVYPVTLIESLICLFLFIIMMMFYTTQKNRLANGAFFAASLLLYGISRFFIDFLRLESTLWFGLSLGQIISAGVVAIVLLILILWRLLPKKGVSYA